MDGRGAGLLLAGVLLLLTAGCDDFENGWSDMHTTVRTNPARTTTAVAAPQMNGRPNVD